MCGYNDTSRSSPDNNNNNNNADFYRSSNRPQSVAGPSSFISGTGKKTSSKTARAHVDANWADFLDVAAADPPPVSTSTSTSLSSNAGRANQAARGKKAGRLLGMPFIGSDDDRGFGGDVDAVDRRVYGGAGIGGAVRLPPVTKAPKGLAYKSDSKPRRSPPPPVPSKKEHLARLAKMTVADVDRNGDGNGTTATPTPTPALIDIAQAQPPPMQNPPAGPVGNIHTTMPSAQTMMPAQQSNQMMMMMTNPYNPFIQVQPQYQQQQQQQFQQQHQFQPHFPNQPTYHHHPQQQISFGGQSMQPTMGMGIGMMSQGNGTMYSQQFQPPNTHQQQPQLYAAASQQMGGNSGGGYYNAQGQGQAQGMNAYGQSQMGQPQQQQPQQMGQGQMMGQMGQMQQGQGMMGWQ
ncbi:hypothetical protein QFC22_003530 [Naganishia vaughanmartiniae]|uniref:Uncharacterized protein n=1 Tax=Naganishia vaughanmartiniae TaxID=1424756 RepID=A0ACC2X6Q3_9TREE|nr:hypothetical protein QFC22_003530 [Naganishia vaughanmartiniae]